MSNYLTWALRQQCTYWPPGVPDRYGNPQMGDPVHMQCRWEDKMELITDPEGQEVQSRAKVFVPQALEINGYLALGLHNGSPIDAGARIIKSVSNIPDLQAVLTEHKVWVV